MYHGNLVRLAEKNGCKILKVDGAEADDIIAVGVKIYMKIRI